MSLAQYKFRRRRLRIVRKRFSDWDKATKRGLWRATLPGGYLKKFILAFPDSITFVAFDGNEIMGWAFALDYKRTVNLYLFVNGSYRKRGVATALVEVAMKSFPCLALAEWDDITRHFFRKIRKRYPARITVYNWWRKRDEYVQLVKTALRY